MKNFGQYSIFTKSRKTLGLGIALSLAFARLSLGGFSVADTIDMLPGPDAYAPQWEALNHATHKLYALGSAAGAFENYAIQVIDTNSGAVVTGIDLGTITYQNVVSAATPYGMALDEGTSAGGNKVYVIVLTGPSQFALRTIANDVADPSSDLMLSNGPYPTVGEVSLVANPNTHRLFYVDEDGEVSVIDGPNHTLITSFNPFVGSGPHLMVQNPNANTVLLFGRDGAALIDGGSSSSSTVTVPSQFSAITGAYNSANGHFYIFGSDSQGTGLFVFDGTGSLLSSKLGGFDGLTDSLVIDPASNTLYLGSFDSGTGSVLAVSTNDLSTKTTFNIGASSLAFDSLNGGNLFLLGTHPGVASPLLRNGVGILNPASGAVSHTTVGYTPNRVAINKVTNRIYVTDEKVPEFDVISGVDHSVIARIPIQSSNEAFQPVAVSEALNRVYLTRSRTESDGSYTQLLDIFDGGNNQLIQSVALGSSDFGGIGPIAVDDTHRRIFVLTFSFQNAVLVELNADTNAIVNTKSILRNLTDIAVNPVTGRLYLAGRTDNGNGIVQVLDGATLNVVATVNAGALPGPMAVNTKTNKLYVANTAAGSVDNTVTVIDGATDSLDTTISNSTHNNGDSITCVEVDEATNTIFVGDASSSGPSKVVLFNGSTHAWQSQVDAGYYPVAMGFNATTKELFVANVEDGTISVLGSNIPPPPPPPANGGLSATVFTVNGSTSPGNNVADTILTFAAQQTGTPGGLTVRVQTGTTSNGPWSEFPDNSGLMILDTTTNEFVRNSNDYPSQNGIYFRAVAAAGGYADSVSNVVGPFNLTSNSARLGTTRLLFTGNGSIADLYFLGIASATPNGLAVRVQASTTPSVEGSWSDLTTGNSGHMTRSIQPAQFILLVNNYPTTQGVYFRALASAPGFLDSISNFTGPFDITADIPPVVTIQPPSGLAGSGDGHDPSVPILVQDGLFRFGASVTSSRPISSLKLQIDGATLTSFHNGETQGSVVTLNVIGDHVLEAVAVDDLGATARIGSGAVYIRIVPSPGSARAKKNNSRGTAAAQSAPRTFKVAADNGVWSDPGTWVDQDNNHGVPTADDFVDVSNHTIRFGLDGDAKSVSINGGRLVGGAVLHIYANLNITNATIVGPMTLEIEGGAVGNLNNASDVQFVPDPNDTSAFTGRIINLGTCNVHGSAGVSGASNISNLGTINWLPPLQIALNALTDPAAGNRILQTALFSNSGVIFGNTSRVVSDNGLGLIGSDSASLIGSDSASVIAAGGGNIVAAGGGNVIAAGGGNIVAAGGGNVIAAGGGNFSALTKAQADSAPPGFIQNAGETNLSAFSLIGSVTLDGGSLTGSGIIKGTLTNNGGYISPGHSTGLLAVTGSFTQAANGTVILERAGPNADQFDQLQVGGTANLGGKLDVKTINNYVPDAADTFNPIGYGSVSGSFASISSNAHVVIGPTGVLAKVDSSVANPSTGQPLNIATRLAIQGGDNVLIAGFIVTGPSGSTKKVLIRGIGPSLANFGVAGTIPDPLLELHKADGTVVTNDNWQQADTSQVPNGFAPSDPRESVIVATLSPGNYSAVLKGAHGEIGVGLAELYDLDPASAAQLGNIATRGFVNTGDNVMIGGFIVGGTEPAKILVRATGPSLTAFGVQGALPATTLELHDSNGSVISNDGWRSTQEAAIQATHLQPTNDNEAAILATLVPGNYTAVVRGKDNTTGIGLVEAYNLP